MTLSTRRELLKIGSAALCLGTTSFLSPRARAATNITYVGWGGIASDAIKKIADAFTAETGIGVTIATGPELAKVKAQVQSGNVSWDVVDGFGVEAGKEGLAEPIDYNLIDARRFLVKPSASAVPINGYVGGIAWDPARSKRPPRDYSQFWDVKNFPGRRGLRNRVSETIEMALVADGVSPDKLYPLDIDRAFRSLEKIKPNVRKWFAETPQGVSLIQTNELDYTYTYLNRVIPARESGVSVDISLDQSTVAMTYSFVPKGSPRKEAAMRFLEFWTRPQQQAAQSTYLKGLAPTVKDAVKLLSPELQRLLPAPNNPKTVYLDAEYWGGHFIELDRRFKEWTLT